MATSTKTVNSMINKSKVDSINDGTVKPQDKTPANSSTSQNAGTGGTVSTINKGHSTPGSGGGGANGSYQNASTGGTGGTNGSYQNVSTGTGGGTGGGKTTAPVGTSGGNGQVSWQVTDTLSRPSGGGGSSGGGTGGHGWGGDSGLTGFTLGSGGWFTDDSGKQYNVQQWTRQPDGTIRNDSTGEIVNKQGQVIGKTKSGYEYSDKDYANRLYGEDGAMRVLTQQEMDAIRNAGPGGTFTIGGTRYTVNADGGVTATDQDGRVFHTRLDGGGFSGVDMHSGANDYTVGDYTAAWDAINGNADVSSLTPAQKEIYDQWQANQAKEAQGGYTPSFMTEEQRKAALDLAAYDAAYLAPEDQEAVAALKKDWLAARDRGDQAGMENANRQANNIRAKYGYEAGVDGATFRMLQPTAKSMEGITLPTYQSGVTEMTYNPMYQGGNWANGLAPASSAGSLTRYEKLADTLKPEQMQGYDLGNYQSALAGQSYQPVQQGYGGTMDRVDLGNFQSALGGLSQIPAALQAGDGQLANFTSALAGQAYNGPQREAEREMDPVRLRDYQSALGNLQYTPQGEIREQELARTTLPQYQAAYSGLTGPELANRDYSQMQNAALQGYQAQTAAVGQVYDAAQAANLAALQRAYESSRAEAEHGMGKIASAYQQQKNEAAAAGEAARRTYMEQAAAGGLNAGNRSQAALALSNSLQNDLNRLGSAQAQAMSDAQFQLDRLQADYQNQISEAIAKNNYERAAALMQEYQTAQKSQVDTAVNQANLNLQTADLNRQVRNDQTNAMQQEFQNRLAVAQGQQADQQAAADLAYRQAALDQQTAQFNREGRQLARDAQQQDFSNRMALAQAQDAAQQAAFDRSLQQANLNMDVAAYNREGRNLAYQAAQQDYANRMAYLQAQDAAQQAAFDRSLQEAAFGREGRQMEYEAAMRNYEAELARAQAMDAAQQAAWNRDLQQAGLNMDVAQYNRETQAMNNQVAQQNWENRMALAQAQDAASQAAFDRALQQAGLDLNVAQYNRDAMQDYYQALQQDFTNRMAVNQEARDAQAQAYDQAYRKAQMEMEGWSLNQDVQQRNFQNELALRQAQDAARQAMADQAYQQANLDLSVWDRNRQADLDQLARQQQMFDNQRTLNGEQYQRDMFDWQKQQDEMDRQERAAQAERDLQQQKWENEFGLTELGAKYNNFDRLAYYGYSPEQIQQMYRFAQLDALGYTW